jgi:hypothetical protein
VTSDTPWSERDDAWPRLRDVALDRLAETSGATESELLEYRRFLRIAEMFPGEISPPPRLAQLWQMHDYDHGAEALGVPYDPAAGQGDVPYCAGRYMKTCKAYEKYFGEVAPRDLWPAPALPSSEDRPPRSGIALAILLLLIAVLADTASPMFRGLLVVGAFGFILHAARSHMAARRDVG